ncbi:MAG: hypothetical protein IPK83_08575 [Planctomycetes bacterium]|nr:hypothetical protein [Planctomycetota bacterium]
MSFPLYVRKNALWPVAEGCGKTNLTPFCPLWSKPHGIPGHWDTMVQSVERRVALGDIQSAYTNRAITTATEGEFASRLRPDNVFKNMDNSFDIFEVLSPSQTRPELVRKGLQYKAILGNRLRKYKILNIGEVPKD